MPITIGGGQMVMAFRSQDLAREAFREVNTTCQEMTPPGIALPISSSVMPEFDKHASHRRWKGKLAERGIVNPPRVCQTEQDIRHENPETRFNAPGVGHLPPAAAPRWRPEHRPIDS